MEREALFNIVGLSFFDTQVQAVFSELGEHETPTASAIDSDIDQLYVYHRSGVCISCRKVSHLIDVVWLYGSDYSDKFVAFEGPLPLSLKFGEDPLSVKTNLGDCDGETWVDKHDVDEKIFRTLLYKRENKLLKLTFNQSDELFFVTIRALVDWKKIEK